MSVVGSCSIIAINAALWRFSVIRALDVSCGPVPHVIRVWNRRSANNRGSINQVEEAVD